MEFDEIVVKESPGLCRCCLSEGCYKDLGSEYTWMNDTEVYADMLLECFDISISQHNDGPNGANRLICEVCITRLRDACNFKKQVLDSEKKFIDMVARGEFRPNVLVYQTQTMKPEPTNEEQHRQENEIEYLEDEMDFGDDEPLKQIEALDEVTEDPTVSEDIMVATLPVKGKRGRPRKSDTAAKPERKAKVPKLEEKPRSSKAIVKETSPPKIKKGLERPENQRGQLRKLLLAILEKSTAMPFRRFGNKYECFFCADEFHLAKDLREHTRTDHVDANLYRSIKFAVTKVGVKLDIADLKCKLCSKDVSNLEILIKHLKEEHNDNCCDETIHYLEYIICFKLSDDEMECLVCGDTFNFFGPLLLHTHRVHSQRQFICEICGNSFASKSSIVKHTQSVHPTDSYQCRHCDKKFFAVHRRDDHEMRIHDVKARQCHICLEVLGSTHKKISHLANVHNIWPAEFKCEKCPKKFMHKNLLVKHDKRTHLKEKNVTCDVCGDKFFDNRLLKLHMVRHSDAKPFECSVCGKRFPRKSALEIHTRIHTNDKRCVCKICGKAFVQTASLKLHIRVHHGDNPGQSYVS